MIIKELELLSSDLAGTEAFYNQVLEIPVVDKTSTGISFLTGHTLLSFRLTYQQKPYYHFAFLIPANKIQEAHNWIAGRTSILLFSATSTIADFSNWNAHAFYFHDNGRNIVEFIAHHDLTNQTKEPFGSPSIIGICEIGVPVEDVSKTCADLNMDYHIPYYKKGPLLDDFAVMGDDRGLLIVTKTGRGWLPTQQPAERYFTRAVLEINGTDHELSFE